MPRIVTLVLLLLFITGFAVPTASVCPVRRRPRPVVPLGLSAVFGVLFMAAVAAELKLWPAQALRFCSAPGRVWLFGW
ncbi:hypothetical protein [Streptomyces sp. NPDC096068]|uniref:hypothetical protein n=1 Tax=Streptomyces sp. NPDC096068 TaxID=3155424 RepID=UPI00332ADA8D